MAFNWLDSLQDSKGRSEYIIAINIDIRGFTPFSLSVESIDLGQYIKSIYLEICNNYFPDAVYSKPMGDGLFVIYNYEESSVKDTVNTIIEKCIELEKKFSTLIKNNPMVAFETPSYIGIGVTRGPACCIYNGEYIIDYSGKILNHAARLMEKARPSGVICDYISFYNILNESLSVKFEENEACLRGVSEKEPIKILVQKNKSVITEADKRPLNKINWEIIKKSYTVEHIKRITGQWWRLALDKRPLNKSDITVEITYPKYNQGGKVPKLENYLEYDITSQYMKYQVRGPTQSLTIDWSQMKARIEKYDISDDEEIRLDIMYPI